jgi:hypothetical protein
VAGHRHVITDAHGRALDLTSPQPHRPPPLPRKTVGRWDGQTVVTVVAIVTTGIVAAVLLVVIRDILMTSLAGGAAGLLLRSLLAPGHRKS